MEIYRDQTQVAKHLFNLIEIEKNKIELLVILILGDLMKMVICIRTVQHVFLL